MADDDAGEREAQRPSLEPPKLFRRRPKKSSAPPAAAEAPTDETPAESTAAPAAPGVPTPAPDETEVVDDPVAAEVPVEDAGDEVGDGDRDGAEGEPVVVVTPEADTAPETAPEAEREKEREQEPADDETDDRPGFTDAAVVPVRVGPDPDAREAEPADEPAPPKKAREPRTPVLVGRTAALVAGLLVGVLLLLLGAGATSTCEAVRGTSACGAALGLPLLAVAVAIGVVAGALLLRLWHVPSPGSTSFMAVALVAVVTGLFLGEALESWVTRIAFPFGVALAFVAAWWLTVSFDDPDVVRRAREDRERQQV